jgi:hypothetical protein
MRWHRAVATAALFFCFSLTACGDSTDPMDPADDYDLVLLPESSLASGCFGWPGEEFSPTNNAGGIQVSVSEGDIATEFTLRDPAERSFTLSGLLEMRPVLMVFGGYT